MALPLVLDVHRIFDGLWEVLDHSPNFVRVLGLYRSRLDAEEARQRFLTNATALRDARMRSRMGG